MASVYRADAVSHIFVSSDTVADDYVLKANETFEDPTGKNTPAKLSGTTWLDATAEEHEAYLKEVQEEAKKLHLVGTESDSSNDMTAALNILGQQLAQVQAAQATLIQSVNELGQQISKNQAQK